MKQVIIIFRTIRNRAPPTVRKTQAFTESRKEKTWGFTKKRVKHAIQAIFLGSSICKCPLFAISRKMLFVPLAAICAGIREI